MDTNHMKFLCLESCLRYCPMVTGFSGWVSGAWPTLSLDRAKENHRRSEIKRNDNNTDRKHLNQSKWQLKDLVILTLWVSVPHPVCEGLPFGNDGVTTETPRKSPRWKKLPESRRRYGRSRNPPCPRRSRTERQRMSPKRWTQSSGSWGACDLRRTRRGRPEGRCGGGPPEWGSRRTDTGTAGTAVPVWPTPPRMPGRRERREGHLWRGISAASAPPLELWSEGLTWVEKQTKDSHSKMKCTSLLHNTESRWRMQNTLSPFANKGRNTNKDGSFFFDNCRSNEVFTLPHSHYCSW